jgi:hypothetical protein
MASPVLRAGLVWLLVLMAGACATTGRRWVEEPEPGLGCGSDPCVADGLDADAESQGAVVSQPAGDEVDPGKPDARGRLDHTVTLGEVTVAVDEPVHSSREMAAPAITVNNFGSGWAPAYGGYYGGWGSGGSRVAPASGGLRMGQDWPSVPSYGPPFPYQTAPGSPWEPAGSASRRR